MEDRSLEMITHSQNGNMIKVQTSLIADLLDIADNNIKKAIELALTGTTIEDIKKQIDLDKKQEKIFYNTLEKILADTFKKLDETITYIDKIIPSNCERDTNILVPIKTYIPDKVFQPRDKVSNKILNEEVILNGNIQPIATESKGQGELTAIVGLKDSFQLTKGINYYDKAVHDTIGNLYKSENEYISFTTLYRAMTGNKRAKVTPSIRSRLEYSLLKLSSTLIYMDCSQEIKGYPDLKGLTPKWRNLIYIQMDQQVNINGGIEDDWIKIMDSPALFEYAYRKKHISEIPLKVLKTRPTKNEDTITLQYYLLDRINRMKNSKVTRNISINTALSKVDYSSCKSEGSIRSKRSKMYKYMLIMLDDFKESEFIKGWKENINKKDKRKYQSVTIELE